MSSEGVGDISSGGGDGSPMKTSPPVADPLMSKSQDDGKGIESGGSSQTLKTQTSRASLGARSTDSKVGGAKAMSYANVNLSPAVTRALSDRSYEKRKSGAIEIEKAIRDKCSHQADSSLSMGAEEYVVTLVNILTMDYACSMNSSQRKGGLIGLAAVALGLGPVDTPKFLQYLLPPVLKCFDDPEVRVRYYACEALYNIAKVARRHILAYFNALFDGLCKLFSDVDVDVKNGAQLLDRLVKEIVTENCDTFQIEMFIPLLEKYLKMTNPYIRQFLIGWILALDAVPDIDMLVHLPRFLDGLFNMLGDGNREIRQQADMALCRFLNEIQECNGDKFEERHLVAICSILISQSASMQKFNRLTAISWLHQFIEIFGERLVMIYASILGVLLKCLSDSEAEIKTVADAANDLLLELVRSTAEPFALKPLIVVVTTKLASDPVSPSGVTNQTTASNADQLQNTAQENARRNSSQPVPLPTRQAALRWISMLLDKFPDDMADHISRLTPSMLSALSDPSDELVLLDLEVLARIARNTKQMDEVIGQVIQLFQQDRILFDNRGSFVIRKLCVLLEPRVVYLILAKAVGKECDLEFSHLMVQNLNLILLTAPELGAFRNTLQQSWLECCEGNNKTKGGAKNECVFTTLYKTWCFDPVATLSLCLLAQSYDLSSMIVTRLASVNVSVGFLMEVDKLVQLLESPAFLRLRLELVNTGYEFRPSLLKTLYGLLMILPQSTAYTTLSNRLNAASSMHLAITSSTALMDRYAPTDHKENPIRNIFSRQRKASNADASADTTPSSSNSKQKQVVEAELLEYFISIQNSVVQNVQNSIHAKSLFGNNFNK